MIDHGRWSGEFLIARNEATSSYRCQPRAKLVGSLLGRFCNSHKVPCRWATAPQLSLENQRCAVTKDGLIPFLQLFVFRQCLCLRRVADQLKSPRSPICGFLRADVALDLGSLFCRLNAGTRRLNPVYLLRRSNPFLRQSTRDDTNVGSRFSWKLATTRNPIPDAPWPRIVGGRRQSQISKLVAKFT